MIGESSHIYVRLVKLILEWDFRVSIRSCKGTARRVQPIHFQMPPYL